MAYGPVPAREILVAHSQAAPVVRVRTGALGVAFAAVALWLAIRLFLTWGLPAPPPHLHDEFSYLLGADTFLHGRLTNPAHPLGRFFESPHILISPTYVSKYPPGQAAWLALGWRLFGSPIEGVVLQGAVLVFVLSLMFFAWTSRRVALVMTLVALYSCLLPPVLNWSLTYWGGFAPAIGAALLLLGVGRFLKTGRPAAAGLLIGLGILELLFTRPYEGGCLCLAALACLPWLARRIIPADASLIRLAAWAAPVLAVGMAWTAYYNHAVTGHALKAPYQLHIEKYDVAPPFWFLPLRAEPVYSSARLAAQHGLRGWEAQQYANVFSGKLGRLRPVARSLLCLAQLLLLVLPMLLVGPLAWWDVRARALLIICGACALSLFLEVWLFTHYAAPAFVAGLLCAACVVQAVQRRRIFGVPATRLLALSVCTFAAGLLIVRLHAGPLHAEYLSSSARALRVRQLLSQPGRHLVVVRYPDPAACIKEEWVYNGADIEGERIVFAHDRGEAENAQLFDHFKGRRRWLATVNCERNELTPLDP